MKSKTRLNSFLRIASLGSAAAIVAAFSAPSAQAVSATWNGAVASNDLNTGGNWIGGTVPGGTNGDTATWDGTQAGNLSLVWSAAFGPTSGAGGGVNLSVLGTQTGSLTLDPGAAPAMGLGNITIAASAGAFSLGDGVGTAAVTLRTGSVSTFTNNSSNVATIASDVVFTSGNAVNPRTTLYTGTGDWLVNNAASSNVTTHLSKAGNGTLTLGGAAKTVAGTLTIDAGTLNLNTDLGLGNASLIKGAGGTIDATGGGRILLNVAGGDLGVSNGGALTINAVIANGTQSTLDFYNTSNGTGAVTLTADNTFSGVSNIQSGVINVSKIGNSGSAGNLGTNGTVNLGSGTTTGTLRYLGTGETNDRVLNLAGTTAGGFVEQAGTGVLKFTADLTATGGGSKTLTLQCSNAGTGEISGKIVDNSGANKTSVTKAGTGTWTLSGANTYTGATMVTAGTLIASGTSTTSGVTVGNPGGAAVFRAASNGGAGARAGSVRGNTGSKRRENNGGVTLANAINQSGKEAVLGAANASIVSISGDNDLAGTISLQTGGSYSAIESTAGTLTLSNGTAITSAATGARGVAFQGAGNSVVSGAIANGSAASVEILKQGSGTTTFSATNNYTGATTVSAGTLVIDGNISTSVLTTVSGGTLQGSGVVGDLSATAGVIAPGNSIGSLGAGNVTIGSGATFAVELDSGVLNADLLDSSGTLNIAPGAILTLTELASGTLASGDKLTLISYTGAWNNGLFDYLGTPLADDSVLALGANQWRFNYDDTSGGSNFSANQAGATGFVTMTVVPEASSALLAGIALLGLLRRRR
jgi:autotransporter-associated beta strand protein